MMNRIQTTLTKQCDALLNLQNNDKASETFGGFSCPACGIYHGRADNAVFPLAYAYKLTGDGKYLAAAEKTLTFRQTLTDTDGGVFNDLDSAWKGITVFSALGFYKTLVFCADVLPGEFRNELERLFAQSAKWVHENLFIGAKAYINYYAASAARKLARDAGVEMPIVEAACRLLYENASLDEMMQDLMERPRRHEEEKSWD